MCGPVRGSLAYGGAQAAQWAALRLQRLQRAALEQAAALQWARKRAAWQEELQRGLQLAALPLQRLMAQRRAVL